MYSYAVSTTSCPASSATICLVLHAITYITHTLSPGGLLMPDTPTLRWHVRRPSCWSERTIYAISTHFRDYNNHETAASWSRLSSRPASPQKLGGQLGLAAMEFLVFCFLPLVSIFPFFQQMFDIELCIAHLAFHGLGREDFIGSRNKHGVQRDGWAGPGRLVNGTEGRDRLVGWASDS